MILLPEVVMRTILQVDNIIVTAEMHSKKVSLGDSNSKVDQQRVPTHNISLRVSLKLEMILPTTQHGKNLTQKVSFSLKIF